jgi:phosphoglycolate phosphatase-like HAD superfamily hydrolase
MVDIAKAGRDVGPWMLKERNTFLLDLDGTLIDHFAAIHRAYVHTMRELGHPLPTLAQVRAAVGGGLDTAIRRFVREDELAHAMSVYREYWNATMLDDVVLLPGARELLQALQARGARLAVLTNKLGTSSRLICEHLGIAGFLGAVVGAQDTPWLKPQPELTAHTLALVGGTADEAIMVGDSPFDVDTGHQSGFPAWCVTTGTHSAAELKVAGADAIFANLALLQAAASAR